MSVAIQGFGLLAVSELWVRDERLQGSGVTVEGLLGDLGLQGLGLGV